MIVPNQNNLKVHFAGGEIQEHVQSLIECSNIKYVLFTVFPFIAKRVGIKAARYSSVDVLTTLRFIENNCSHSIMDSGLFTLMFGAHAGKRDYKFVNQWYENIVDFVNTTKYNGTCVEVDCQKILGIEKAWEFRERMKVDLPNNRQINVFHLDDGQAGLERMIEFSDYIAVSVPELRNFGKVKYINKIVHFIKNKKPDIDIHLLGCTQKNILKDLKFCSSSDSTSWQQVNRFGYLTIRHDDSMKMVKASDISAKWLFDTYGEKVRKILVSNNIEPTKKRVIYLCRYGLAGDLLKEEYRKMVGCQD